jgi:Protein of unknown function (DUF732)
VRAEFVFAAVTTGAALAMAMAAPANADPTTDAIFIQVLDEEGIPYTSASDAIDVANGVCVFMSEGNSLQDAVVQVSAESGLGVEDSGFFVGAATQAYCQEYSP